MLVLTRQSGQTIVIGTDIVIRVIEVRGRRVRLGIEAPRDITVDRGEVAATVARDGRRELVVQRE